MVIMRHILPTICIGLAFLAGWSTHTPDVRAADPKVVADRIEIPDATGRTVIVLHSKFRPTLEVTDDKGKTIKLDLVLLSRRAALIADEK